MKEISLNVYGLDNLRVQGIVNRLRTKVEGGGVGAVDWDLWQTRSVLKGYRPCFKEQAYLVVEVSLKNRLVHQSFK